MSGREGMPTGTVTMLFTDIEGSTRLLKQLGERYGELLADHRRLLREAFGAHGGREMDTQGDAFFYAFARARDAVEGAIEAQRALAAHEWPAGAECRVRMGLHTGEPRVGDEGYHGLGLHRGARITAAAHGGQILLSSATAQVVEDDLPSGVSLRDLGNQLLRDMDRPQRIYQIVGDGLKTDFPSLRTAGAKRRRKLGGPVAATVPLAALAVAAGLYFVLRGGSGPTRAAAATVSVDSLGVLNPSNGRLTGEVSVGASPGAVAGGDGSIWVANVDARSVSRVDPVKQVTIQTIPVGTGPAGVAVGDRFVWVTNGPDGTVTQIDPQVDRSVNTIRVGTDPSGVAVDGANVWVANSGDGTITEIDARTGLPTRTIAVGQSADGIAVGFGSIWVTSVETGTVTRVDGATGVPEQPIATGGGANAVAVGAGAVWVANELDGTVTRIDPATNSVRATITVGRDPGALAVDRDSVWVANGASGTLSRIDPARNITVGPPVKTGSRPRGIVLSSGSLFVAVRGSGAGHRGGTLTVLGDSAQIPALDPAQAYAPAQIQLLAITNDGLTAFRKVGGSAGKQLVPDLAVSLPTPTGGGRSYTFHLRRGIRYSTGALVRPGDIRRQIERYLTLNGSFIGTGLENIVGAARCGQDSNRLCDLSGGIATDDVANTITFRLVAPDPEFLHALAGPNAVAVPQTTPLHVRGFVPATGPYTIASLDPRRGVRLVRNARFREWSSAAQPAGFPDVIVERFDVPRDARVAAVLRGSADVATSASAPSAAVLRSVQMLHASQVEIDPYINTWEIILNTRIPPFDDERARQAFNFAIDRRRLMNLTIVVGTPTCQILPPGLAGYQPYCPYTVHPTERGTWTAPDLARARQLVRASGTAGQKVSFWIPGWIGFDVASGRYVVSVLDSIGYKAVLKTGPNPYGSEDRLHVQAGFSGWVPTFPTPSGFIVGALNCASYSRNNAINENFAEFCNPAIDRKIFAARAAQTTDPAAATRLWTQVDRELTDAAPWVPFANGVTVEVKATRVGNYQYNPQIGTLLDQLWVK